VRYLQSFTRRVQIVAGLAVLLSFAAAFLLYPVAPASASPEGLNLIGQSSFVDSQGRLNVVGTVENSGYVPVSVVLGLNTTDSSGNSKTLHETTYGRVIYPAGESPFKFTVDSGLSALGGPFIVKADDVAVPFYNLLALNYSNMAVGDGKALLGTARNTGTFNLYNVSIFASVHDHKGAQIDTVRSNVIPVIKPGEVKSFSALPDPAIRANTLYYSCAGVDIDTPIPTVDLGGGRFIAYNFKAFAEVSNVQYSNATGGITFAIRHYNPGGGPAELMVPEFAQNQNIAVVMDGKPDASATVKQDGKTVYVDFFVPTGTHQVQVQRIMTVPEMPPYLVVIGLAMSMASAVFLARSKLRMA